MMKIHMNHILPVCLLIFLLGVHPAPGSNQKNLLQAAMDPNFQPKPGTYTYLFNLNSISIGTGQVVVSRDGDLYKMVVTAQTNSAIDHIYKFRYRGENIINTDHAYPVETTIRQQIRSNRKDMAIRFQDNGKILTTEKKSDDDDKTSRHEIRTERFTLDPFSVTYLVRALNWSVGTEQVFDMYTGKSQYELRLKCTGMKVVEMGTEKRNAWVITPSAKKKDAVEDSKKMPMEMQIYVSADDLKDVLELDASYKIGHLRALMEKFEPSESADKPVIDSKQVEISRDYKAR